MKTTYFKPSIHGWPFGNSWSKSLVVDGIQINDLGFCGGMCWRALQRFYNAVPIPRDIAAPAEGDAIYEEIWTAQKNSVTPTIVWRLLRWQASPDISHRTNPLHSQGHRTQKEWPKVKDSIDASKPVTITLTTTANDGNPVHLGDTHRVVAYAYDIDNNPQGTGVPRGADSKVTLWIYDPNFENEDDVKFTFYLGAERNRIRLRHSHTESSSEYHGFFLDDKDRNYRYSDTADIQIESCQQTGIISFSRATYDLTFSWHCRFIPYFNLLINGTSWQYNNASNQAKYRYEPASQDIKQCPDRNGQLRISLELPRNLSTLAVRLLEDDSYFNSIEVDTRPDIKCYPYLHSRAVSDQLCICDYDINDTDLFVKNGTPSDSAVQQLDTSEFRWVKKFSRRHNDTRRRRDDLTTAYIEALENYKLGNVIVPVFANFEEKNLAAPTVKSGRVRIIKNGTVVQTIQLNPMTDQGQKIFDGFQDNPSDYDNNSRVELTYQSRDTYNVSVQGQAVFHGRSILYWLSTITVSVFDPAKLGRLEGIARELIERGLIDIAINPPIGPGPRPDPWPVGTRPNPKKPFTLLRKLRRQRELQGKIRQAFKSSWGNSKNWKDIWEAQSVMLKQKEIRQTITSQGKKGKTRKGQILKAVRKLQAEQQNTMDGIALNIMTTKAITALTRDRDFMKGLMSL